MTRYFRKIIFLARCFGVLIKYIWLYLFAKSCSIKKSIIVIPQNYSTGGTRRFTHNLLNYLIEKEYEITILLEKGQKEDFLNYFHYLINKLNIIETKESYIHHQHYYPLQHSLFKYFILDVLKQTIELLKIQIKTRNSKFFLSIARPTEYFQSFFCPAKIFFVVHTNPWIEVDNGNWWLLHKIKDSRKFNLITVSIYTKELIEKFWGLNNYSKEILVLPNYSEDMLVSKVLEDDKELKIVCIASVIKDKNPFYFIECAKRINSKYQNQDISFIWVGGGKLLDECKKLSSNIKNVRFLGHNENVRDILSTTNIYFQPSLGEPHGIAVVEAMSCGIPCVVTANGGTRESVIEGINGFHIDPYDINDGVNKLSKLIENKTLCKRFGEKSRQLYEQKFTKTVWSENVNKMLKL